MRKKPPSKSLGITRVILASSSPRRVALLNQAGISVQTVDPRCDETPIRGESPRSMVSRLAQAKAQSVAARVRVDVSETILIVAADTTVVEPSKKRILGKPTDPSDAERMLQRIVGKTHDVLTGFCVIELRFESTKKVTRVVRTRVSLRKLSRRQISAYVQTGEPLDKAGSYAAQGLGMNFIRSISGSYTNVVGLPMSELLEVLEDEFGFELFS